VAGSERKFFDSEDKTGRPAVVRRKLTRWDSDAAATGVILSYFFNSSSITSTSEWTNISALYEEYRVRAIRVRFCPIITNVQEAPYGAATDFTGVYPGPIVSGRYTVGVGANSVSSLLSQDGSKVHPNNSQMMEQMVTWESNPQAKLWTAIGASPPAAQQIGVEYIGTQAAFAVLNTVVTHYAFVEMDVEFRGRN